MGIVGIIAYVYFALAGLGIFDNFTSDYDSRIGETDKEKIKLIKIHIEIIEKRGYEVLYFGYFEYNHSEIPDSAYIKMKSLGNRNEQLFEGLTSLSNVYPDASEYEVKILEESRDCFYSITGDVYRARYDKSVEEITVVYYGGRPNITGTPYEVLQYQLQDPSCS